MGFSLFYLSYLFQDSPFGEGKSVLLCIIPLFYLILFRYYWYCSDKVVYYSKIKKLADNCYKSTMLQNNHKKAKLDGRRPLTTDEMVSSTRILLRNTLMRMCH